MLVVWTLVVFFAGDWTNPAPVVVPNHPDKEACEQSATRIRLLLGKPEESALAVCLPTVVPQGYAGAQGGRPAP